MARTRPTNLHRCKPEFQDNHPLSPRLNALVVDLDELDLAVGSVRL